MAHDGQDQGTVSLISKVTMVREAVAAVEFSLFDVRELSLIDPGNQCILDPRPHIH